MLTKMYSTLTALGKEKSKGLSAEYIQKMDEQRWVDRHTDVNGSQGKKKHNIARRDELRQET